MPRPEPQVTLRAPGASGRCRAPCRGSQTRPGPNRTDTVTDRRSTATTHTTNHHHFYLDTVSYLNEELRVVLRDAGAQLFQSGSHRVERQGQPSHVPAADTLALPAAWRS
jgi:hypothetical protein